MREHVSDVIAIHNSYLHHDQATNLLNHNTVNLRLLHPDNLRPIGDHLFFRLEYRRYFIMKDFADFFQGKPLGLYVE